MRAKKVMLLELQCDLADNRPRSLEVTRIERRGTQRTKGKRRIDQGSDI